MAYKASSFLALFLISNILVATTFQAAAGRKIIPKNSNTQDKKEPEWFFNFDGGVFVPGIGQVGFPPVFDLTPQNPYPGGSEGPGAGAGSGVPGGHTYVPGGDDTFVPNPGYEVPNPGSVGGGVPAAVHP